MTRWAHSNGFPPATRARILRRHPACQCRGCDHCGDGCAAPSVEADHVIPVAEGGTDHETNGQGMCRACHWRKTLAEGARGRARRDPRRPAEPHPGLLTEPTRGGG